MIKKKRIILCVVCGVVATLIAVLLLPLKSEAEPDLDNGSSLFCQGLLCVQDFEGKWGYVNRKGEEIIKVQFDEAEPFTENGTAKVKADGEWKHIDTKGRFVESPAVQKSSPSAAIRAQDDSEEDDVPLFSQNGLWGLRDSGGNILVQPRFIWIEDFAENGLALFYLAGQCGYINRAGEIVIPNRFNHAYSFSDNGLAAVSRSGKWGYINAEGEYAMEPQFDAARPFSTNGCAAVRVDRGWGVINDKGKFLVEPTFDSWVTDFGSDGLALAEKDGMHCFVNIKGEIIYTLLEGTYDIFYGFDDGTIGKGLTEEGWYLFDRKGNIIIGPGSYRSCYERYDR